MDEFPTLETSKREAWIEPLIEELHVSETAAQPSRGGDGGMIYPDCTKS